MLRDSNSKLIQFLMKLNDEYEYVRSQIIAMDPLPTVNKAYYIIQQIEKQKQVTNHTFEPFAFFANMNNKGSRNDERKENKGSRNDGKRKKAKKQGKIASNVSTGLNDHCNGDTPFDLGSENKIGGECVLTATYLINKMLVKLLDWKSPYEKLYGKPPTYDHLRVIGCLCYAAVVKPHKDKFENRGVKCVLIGYPVNQKEFTNIPSSHVAFLANVFATPEPASYKQAIKHKGWVKAMEDELAALERNQTWTITSLPAGKIGGQRDQSTRGFGTTNTPFSRVAKLATVGVLIALAIATQ
nr:hypothetical protein [Tanacetum cinerariifolium]